MTTTEPAPAETVPESELITVSFSEIDSARHCGLKHRLQYQERWASTEPTTGGRAVGTDWHKLLEAHHRALKQAQADIREGKHPGFVAPAPRSGRTWSYPEAIAEQIHAAINDPEGLAAGVLDGPYAEQMEWMYNGYLDRYGLSADWTILAVEYKPNAILPNPNGGPSRFQLKAKLDLVIQNVWDGTVRVVDNKSGSRAPDVRALGLSDQFALYTWILRANKKDVAGSIYSFAKTTQPVKTPNTLEERFRHFPLDHTEFELDQVAANAYDTCEAAYNWDPDAHGGRYLVYPDPEWCKRRCDFVNAHLASRRGFVELRDYLEDTGFARYEGRH